MLSHIFCLDFLVFPEVENGQKHSEDFPVGTSIHEDIFSGKVGAAYHREHRPRVFLAHGLLGESALSGLVPNDHLHAKPAAETSDHEVRQGDGCRGGDLSGGRV